LIVGIDPSGEQKNNSDHGMKSMKPADEKLAIRFGFFPDFFVLSPDPLDIHKTAC
jgi:hypothetical protein